MSSNITLQTLRPFLAFSREEAAKRLGMGLSSLKRCCASLGIQRWPHRKLASLFALRDHHGLQRAQQTPEQESLLMRIQQDIDAIMENPDHPVDHEVAKQRVSKYKTLHTRGRKMDTSGLPSGSIASITTTSSQATTMSSIPNPTQPSEVKSQVTQNPSSASPVASPPHPAGSSSENSNATVMTTVLVPASSPQVESMSRASSSSSASAPSTCDVPSPTWENPAMVKASIKKEPDWQSVGSVCPNPNTMDSKPSKRTKPNPLPSPPLIHIGAASMISEHALPWPISCGLSSMASIGSSPYLNSSVSEEALPQPGQGSTALSTSTCVTWSSALAPWNTTSCYGSAAHGMALSNLLSSNPTHTCKVDMAHELPAPAARALTTPTQLALVSSSIPMSIPSPLPPTAPLPPPVQRPDVDMDWFPGLDDDTIAMWADTTTSDLMNMEPMAGMATSTWAQTPHCAATCLPPSAAADIFGLGVMTSDHMPDVDTLSPRCGWSLLGLSAVASGQVGHGTSGTSIDGLAAGIGGGDDSASLNNELQGWHWATCNVDATASDLLSL